MTDDFEDSPDTGRIALRGIAAGKGNDAVMAAALDQLLGEQQRARGAQRERQAAEARSAMMWRTAAGAAVSVAIALASWAVALAQGSALRQERLERVEALAEHTSATVLRVEREARDRTDVIGARLSAMGAEITAVRSDTSWLRTAVERMEAPRGRR